MNAIEFIKSQNPTPNQLYIANLIYKKDMFCLPQHSRPDLDWVLAKLYEFYKGESNEKQKTKD